MTLFYKLAYAIGFAPWEQATTYPPAVARIAGLFDREARERQAPYGKALDLGCGTGFWSVELAKRGWSVTGIDMVHRAVAQARERARKARLDISFIEGDMTALRDAGVGTGFSFFWDFGALHGLSPAGRMAVGREVTAVAAPDATMVMVAFVPARRVLLPRGVSRAEIEAAFPDWTVVEEQPFNVSGRPPRLRSVDLRCYRLRRTGAGGSE